MRKIRIFAYICLFALFAIPFWGAQLAHKRADLYSILNDSINPSADSLPSKLDTTGVDSLAVDSVHRKKPLDAIVDYKWKDSIVLTKDNWAYLFGDAKVDYGEIKLASEIISMNMDSSTIAATFGLDSIGEEFGYPVFANGGTDYETKTMKYNFKTKQGYSEHLVTEQGEGYVVAKVARINEDNSSFIQDGMYTTCDQHDHPHFYLKLTRGKVHPKKDVIVGPAYLVIEDLHIPFIGLPFGFFPFTDSYTSGVIMPSYGDEMDRGFNLHDGGYYLALNDHIDLKLLGTIYTKGSWGLRAESTYRKRYKFSGNFNVGYQVSKYGDKGIDQSISKDLKVTWSHSQDPKADMFRTFSANVDFATTSYDRNNVDNQFTSASTSNTKASSVSFSQRFPNSPWSITGSMNINQRSDNKTINATFPNIAVSMSRVYPFKRKEAVGSEKWFEKIQFSYSADLRNTIQTKEDDLSLGFSNWNNAIQHKLPVSATFSIFNHINITPSLQYTERWYTKRTPQKLVAGQLQAQPKENKLSRVFDFNASLGLQTKMYGFFNPIFSPTTTIRHVFTPSVTFSYAPDFSRAMWGYYESLYGYNPSTGVLKEYQYSPYRSEMFGAPGQGATGMITFDFQNNIEMKMPWQSDSTGYKKISLIDNLGINFSYNMQAEKFKWSDPRVNLRLKLSKSLTVNLNATFDPYTYGYENGDLAEGQRKLERLDRLRISEPGKGFLRLMSTGYSISPSINQDTFNKWFGKNENDKNAAKEIGEEGVPENETPEDGAKRLLGGKKEAEGEYDSDGYIKNQVRWSLGFSFSMNYAYDRSRIDHKNQEYKRKLSNNLSFNGSIQPTKHWSLNFSASYDFDQKKIPHMTCNISRDLHCWNISASLTPVGMYKSYYVTLRANSSMLQDLKHEFKGRSSSYDPNWD